MNVPNSIESRSRQDFEPNRLIELVGDDRQLLAEAIDLFERDSARLVARVREAADKRDVEALRRSAHALRGMLSNLGESMAIDRCLHLETLPAIPGPIVDVVEDLTIEVASIRQALARLAP